MNRLSVLACLLFIFTPSCKDMGASSDQISLRIFSYTAFDTLGQVKVRGIIALYNDSSKITGNWQFDNDGSGQLEGIQSGDMISLNLNPGFVDNNLLLRGKLSGNNYNGDWQKVGYPGVMDWGTFSAIRK